MINAPVSLTPIYIFVTLAVFCFAAWGGIIPLPGWMQVMGLYLGVASFAFACLCALDVAIDRAVRYANIDDLLNPDARIAEAVSKMNHEQVECLYNALGYSPDAPADEYVTLDDGATVSRDAILQISANAHGIDLRPEREYSANQAQIRYAHDTLANDGTFEAARGRRGPRIKDPARWEKVVDLAKAKAKR